MSPIFLDTSGLIAVVNTDDQWHPVAEPVWQSLIAAGTTMVTTSLVLIEIGDGLSRLQFRRLAVEIHDRLHTSARVEIVQTTRDIEDRAWQLYRQRHDKEWGMTDCASMIVMQEHGIGEVFTSDHHFQQAGFNVLLKR